MLACWHVGMLARAKGIDREEIRKVGNQGGSREASGRQQGGSREAKEAERRGRENGGVCVWFVGGFSG